MKVIDVIKSMQAAIDALSFHSADTEVIMEAGLSRLTGAIEVDGEDGEVLVRMEHISYADPDFDIDWSEELHKRIVNMRNGATKKFKTPASWGNIRDRVTTVGNVVTMNPPDCLTHGRPVVDDMINDALVHQQWMDICLRGGEDNGDGIVNRWGEDSDFARDMGWTKRAEKRKQEYSVALSHAGETEQEHKDSGRTAYDSAPAALERYQTALKKVASKNSMEWTMVPWLEPWLLATDEEK